MSELKFLPCPFCGGEAKVIEDSMLICGHRYWRIIHNSNDCPITDAFGIFRSSAKYSTAEKAIAAWNRRAQPENEALTLSELRWMGGEPVWIQESAPYTFAGYKILCSPVVDEYEDVCFEGGDCYYSHDYGKTWFAYRTKPERSEGE